MAIHKLFEEAEVDQEQESCESMETAQSCKMSLWKSIGLRFAFLFAALFCVFWFAWSCLAYTCWVMLSLIPSRGRFHYIRKRTKYSKSLGLTAVSFVGCSVATLSPYFGLSFLSAYFGLFSSDSSNEGIYFDELIAKVKRLSA